MGIFWRFGVLLGMFFLLVLHQACSKKEWKEAAFDAVDGAPHGAVLDTVKKYVKYYPDHAQFSLAILDGDKVWKLGMERKDDRFVQVQNEDKQYEIGSITKTFTAALLAKMISENIISLDEQIANQLDFEMHTGGEFDSKKITYRHLAQHTSGLPRLPSNMLKDAVLYSNNPYKRYDVKRLEKYLTTDLELKTEPGSSYRYSNLGYGFLGYLESKVLKGSYEKIMLRLIESMALQQTGFDLTDRVIKGINDRGKRVDNWEHNVLAGCHALKSSLDDMVRYAQYLMTEQDSMLSILFDTKFAIDATRGVSLAWHYTTIDGQVVYWHNGGTGGYSCCMLLDRTNHKAVIFLSNVSALAKQGRAADRVAFGLMKQLCLR